VNKLEVDGITDGHYEDMIKALQAGLRQRQAIRDDEEHAQEYCFICEGNDHTADQCWFHNPLLLTTMGEYALIGDFWRCFHCGAVHTTLWGWRGGGGQVPAAPRPYARLSTGPLHGAPGLSGTEQ
jgi:hypothetical protein